MTNTNVTIGESVTHIHLTSKEAAYYGSLEATDFADVIEADALEREYPEQTITHATVRTEVGYAGPGFGVVEVRSPDQIAADILVQGDMAGDNTLVREGLRHLVRAGIFELSPDSKDRQRPRDTYPEDVS